ncbi:MAG: PAS domain S-box protein [Methylocystis sp.]|nr:PAS domain S-box protein [Methylocystis sp.]MCA3585075.1 PAS domain S-box protein [Methylocystis sp.]MCA3587792.1 PAS domain S-box protein [Methylocystis sp.]MCA3592293.1 PAS domain S-box protein [Methylocystis sp.]
MASESSTPGLADHRYAKILALAIDAIICIDGNQRIVLFNNGAEATFGFKAADIIGRSIDTLIPARFHARHAQHVATLAGGPPVARHMGERQAIYALRKSGEEFPAEATISKIALEDGSSLLTVVLRDISERFNAETRRRQDAEKLRRALSAGRLGGFEQDLATGRMLLFGDTPGILGLPGPECGHAAFLDLVHADDRGNLEDAMATVPLTGALELEYRIRRPDGACAWIRSICMLVRDERERPHIFGTLQDISAQKDIEHELERRVAERTDALQAEVRHREETQQQLVRAQRMEAFGQLTGGIAHDFNNLLTIVGGNLELLQDQVIGEKPQRQLKRALEAVGMGSRLTERLLTFARRGKLEPEVLNLNDQVVNVIDLLVRTLGETITISSVLAPDLGRVLADASEVENAILNLAINARDAMPSGGTLMIETANATVDGTFAASPQGDAVAPGRYVRLSVADSGSGMIPEVLAKAFEPFFTTKEHGRGTGLGLATIYGFARQSGGYATIYSEPGLGTTVNIYLPRSEQAEPPREDSLMHYLAADNRRILVVEDQPDVREVAIERLGKLGYRTCACESGPDAVALLQEDPDFDLVFSDILMAGGMSGYDLAVWVRTNRPAVKILLTSGFPNELARQTAGKHEAFAVLQKPYATADLAAALQEAFRSG